MLEKIRKIEEFQNWNDEKLGTQKTGKSKRTKMGKLENQKVEKSGNPKIKTTKN